MEEIELTAVQKKMEEFIRRERLLEMGDRVVLGVSGGADSVCMMELFAAIREAWQLELLVVHVHHGLRGALLLWRSPTRPEDPGRLPRIPPDPGRLRGSLRPLYAVSIPPDR